MKRSNQTRIRMAIEKPSYSCYEIRPTIHGYHWIIHRHDRDINEPSCPHCHAKGKDKIKLDIYSGCIYDYTNGRKNIEKLRCDELRELWSLEGFRRIVKQERHHYNEKYHKKNKKRYPELPPIPYDEGEKASLSLHRQRALDKRWLAQNRIIFKSKRPRYR